jgi:hypothetical protein
MQHMLCCLNLSPFGFRANVACVANLSVITLTGNRVEAFSLLEKYVKRQSWVGLLQWIVVDDGSDPVCPTLNQEYVRRKPSAIPHESYRQNFLAALQRVKCDKVIVLEDDDWYGCSYLSEMATLLEEVELAGLSNFFIYNVRYRRFQKWNHPSVTCCMSHSAFRATLVPRLSGIIQRSNTLYPDVILWREAECKRVFPVAQLKPALTVGIKGLPGREGISYGHRPGIEAFQYDHDAMFLRELIGDDADAYMIFFEPTRPFFSPWISDRL